MKLEKQDRFQDRYLPPFFKGDWESLPIPQAEDIWRAVSKLPATQKALKEYRKSDFIKPDAIDGRALLLKPFGYDVYIMDFELVKGDDVIALPILQTEKGLEFDAGSYFIDSKLDNGLDEPFEDVLIHNLSHLDAFMRFHVTNNHAARRGQRNIIIESLEDLWDWYDISNVDPRLIHLPIHDINEFETDFRTGEDGFRRYVGYSCKVIGWGNQVRTLRDSYCKEGWRSHENYDRGNGEFCYEEPQNMTFDLSLCKQKISRGPLRFYLDGTENI